MSSRLLSRIAVALALSLGSLCASASMLSANNCTQTLLSQTYSNCAGTFAGNNLGHANPGAADTLAFINTAWGPGFTTIRTVDNPTDANGAAPGYRLDLGSVFSGELVFALKQANGFALYHYESFAPSQFLSFDQNAGFGGRGNADISHFTVYAAPVPEPETYALLMGGLGAMGFVARRRSRR